MSITRYYAIEWTIIASGHREIRANQLFKSLELAEAELAAIKNHLYEPCIVILDIIGTPLMHGGKVVGVVPL